MFHGWAQDAIAFLTATARAHPFWAFPIAFATAFTESFVGFSILVPGFAILVALGTVIGASNISVVPAILGAASGAICGNWISWWLGCHYHHQLVHLWPFRKFEPQIEKALHFFHRWGAWGVFFGQFLGPFRATVPLVAGMSELEFMPFITASTAAALLWATLLLAFPAFATGMF
jgi:membrane protein DedA with SNARE-associated domain